MIIFLFYKNAEREQSFVLSLTIAHEIHKKKKTTQTTKIRSRKI